MDLPVDDDDDDDDVATHLWIFVEVLSERISRIMTCVEPVPGRFPTS